MLISDVMGTAHRVTVAREGSLGDVAAEQATALVLVLTELVQNAIEHAFPDDRDGTVTVVADRARGELRVLVRDDGVGLPEGFTATGSDRLGLQIVTTLVAAELGGRVSFRSDDGTGGTVAEVVMPLARRPRERPVG